MTHAAVAAAERRRQRRLRDAGVRVCIVTARPWLQVLFELCRFRNHHPAFNGTFELLDTIQDILDSTVIVPGSSPEGPGTTPIPMPGADAPPRLDRADTGDLSSSFHAQQISLLASLDGEEADFLADIVLDRGSIDVLASMDRGDLEDDTVWCARPSPHPLGTLRPNPPSQHSPLQRACAAGDFASEACDLNSSSCAAAAAAATSVAACDTHAAAVQLRSFM